MVDLSKAAKLREVAFWFGPGATAGITNTLRSISPEHRDLKKVSIYADLWCDRSPNGPIDPKEVVGEVIYKQWMDLDALLVQLWESQSIRTKLVGEKAGRAYRLFTSLLPQVTERGIIEQVAYADHRGVE